MTTPSYQRILEIANSDKYPRICANQPNGDQSKEVADVAVRVDKDGLSVLSEQQFGLTVKALQKNLVKMELAKNIVGLASNISFYSGLLFILQNVDSQSSLLLSAGLLSVYMGYNGIQMTLNLHSITENPKQYFVPELAFPLDIKKIKETIASNTVGGFSFLMEKGMNYMLKERI